jgi:hypothetical protein
VAKWVSMRLYPTLETDITCSNSAERPWDKFQVDKVEQVNVCKVESLQTNWKHEANHTLKHANLQVFLTCIIFPSRKSVLNVVSHFLHLIWTHACGFCWCLQ